MRKYGQPAISRETRLLLITIVVSIAALWVLARLRFHERPVASAPVAPVLAQLRPSTGYADLARLIAEIRTGVMAAVFASSSGGAALRIREDVALTLAPATPEERLASDRATGLTIVRSAPAGAPGLMPWAPRALDYPRYLVAAELAGENLALRPVFVSGLFPATSPLWSEAIWALPPATQISAGTFVFTTDGAFAGLTVEHGRGMAIVPPVLLLETADQLLRGGNGEAATIGVTVEPLSPAVAAASGAREGMVVTAVDRDGPAAGTLLPTDVIEGIDGQGIGTSDHWRARIARLSAGETLSLRVRANGDVRDVEIVAAATAAAPVQDEDASLGLRLRAIPSRGAEVLSVRPRSRGAQAAFEPGDIITVAARQLAPTPAHVARAFAGLPERGLLLVAVTRRGEHRVLVVEK